MSHVEQFCPFGALWVFSSPAVPPVTLQGVAQPYNRGRRHIVTEGLENTGSGDNRVRQINLLCSKPELYPLSSMKNWSGGEREMQSISFAKIMRQKGIKPPPLCFVVKQNIGEVSCNDGEVKFFKNLFGGFFNSPRRQECTYRQEIHCQNSSLSPHELSTEPSSYSSQKDFFRLSSKEMDYSPSRNYPHRK